MKIAQSLMFAAASVYLAGCTGGPTEKTHTQDENKKPAARSPDQQNEEADINAAFAKLEPKDRQLAEVQKFCAVQNNSRLGSMGTPVKVMVKNQPVFLCCKSCQKKALADPDKTLSKVTELKAKSGGSEKHIP
jgi:hypothetical protein